MKPETPETVRAVAILRALIEETDRALLIEGRERTMQRIRAGSFRVWAAARQFLRDLDSPNTPPERREQIEPLGPKEDA